MTQYLKIAVDLRPLLEAHESGVTVYTKAMVAELLKYKDVQLDLFYQAAKRDEKIHALFPKVRHIALSNTRFHLRSLFAFPALPGNYFEKKPDLIWIPDRRPFYRCGIPLVMTIHDQVPEKFARTLSFKSRLWHRLFSLKRLLKLSSGILLPSSTSGLGLPRSLVKEVTFEGAKLASEAHAPKNVKHLKKRPFFLCISPADPRKRLKWVIKMAKQFPKAHFAIVGLKPGDKRFAKTGLKKMKNLFLYPQISEEEKLWFLKKARALLALSAYEGFDLPVLEAVRAKCPVIMSDIAVHNELYKNDQPMVGNLDDLRLAIHKALNGDVKVPKSRGVYDWEGAARRALLLFRRVLHHKDR